MKMLTFSSRVAKEILRDPLTLAFGLGFPIVLLLLMTAIQANIPVEIFALESLTPGIAVFGLSFMTLFSATIVAKDRSGSLLLRLYTTPICGGFHRGIYRTSSAHSCFAVRRLLSCGRAAGS